MIKIVNIDPPKKKFDPAYIAQCCCGVTFTFNASDEQSECFGHGDFQRVVHCPRCGRTNDYATIAFGEMKVEALDDAE